MSEIRDLPQEKPSKHILSDHVRRLAIAWDDAPAVRQRMRDGYNLCCHYDPKLQKLTNTAVGKNMRNIKENAPMLMVVCQWVRQEGHFPPIGPLAEQVRKLYSIYNRSITNAQSNDQAWYIRYLLNLLKSTVRNDRKGVKTWPKDLDLRRDRIFSGLGKTLQNTWVSQFQL